MTDDLTHYMEATERMRIRAEQVEAERDHLQDDLASVAMAVAGDRTGVIEQDDIVGLVREVVAERDRLRAVVEQAKVSVERERELTDAARAARERAWKTIRELEAERDRLRAVVDALNEEHAALWRVVNALRLHEQTVAANQDGAEQAIADRWQAVEQALDALDGSEVMGDG